MRSWALDILSALQHLQSLDPVVIHRDLKPSNILLAAGPAPRRLKLADFGLAKGVPRAAPQGPADAAEFRRAHTCNIGTRRSARPRAAGMPPQRA